jgi:hypothetical protein
MKRVPKYIKKFMGMDFRSVEGMDASFELSDFINPDFNCGVENRPGCYIISSPNREIEYANGKKSPILYIGCSDKLYRRLHDEHYNKHYRLLKENKDLEIYKNYVTMMSDKYQYMLYYGCHVDVFYCKGVQTAKNFESTLLASFYDTYRCTPVGNAARSFRVESQ